MNLKEWMIRNKISYEELGKMTGYKPKTLQYYCMIKSFPVKAQEIIQGVSQIKLDFSPAAMKKFSHMRVPVKSDGYEND